MAKKFPLLSPGSVGPSSGPFGDTTPGKATALSPFGRGRARPRVVTTLKRGGKYQSGGRFKTTQEAREYAAKKQDEYNADKAHQEASRNLDRAFGYGRLLMGQPLTYDAALTVNNTGLFDYLDPRDRPLRQRSWGEQSRGVPTLPMPGETGGSPFARGGKVPRFDFGGLFGGQPGTTTQQTNQAVQSTGATNNNIADPQYNQLRDQTLTNAANLDFSDPSKYIAGFNQDQQNAFQGVRNNQGSTAPYYGAAEGSFGNAQGTAGNLVGSSMPYVQQAGQMQTGTQAFNPFAQQADQTANNTVGSYMSPYQQNAMAAVGQASNTAFTAPGGPMERINDTFTGGNAAQFGRERHGDVMGNAVYNQQQALDQSLSQMANTGYQSAMTSAQTDLQRQAGLGSTAGQLANAGIGTEAALGQTAANIGTAGTQANVQAGTAQQGLGTATQNAGYTDANALLSVGNQQQQLAQQQASMPLQGLQYQQSLGQGWQLPTSSNFLNTNNSGGSSTTTQSQPQGSIAGQVVGAGATLAGALGGGDSNKNPDGTTKSARGGQINPFGYATGGYVPTVTGVRKRNAMRTPPPSPLGPMGGMGGMQPTGMPGMPPPAPPAAAALNPTPQPPPPMPHPTNRRFARGGPFNGDGDEAQDRAMITRGIHQHERGMHNATSGQLTKLRLARGGRVTGYDTGGPTVIPKPLLPMAQPASPFSDSADINKRMTTAEDSEARFPSMPVAVAAASPFVGSDAGVGTGGVGGSATDGSGGSAAAGTSGGPGDGVGGGDAGSGTYAGGGGVPGYAYGGLEIRGNPTPSIRGNLPPPVDYGDDSQGHEVPSPDIEWYQRGHRGEGDLTVGQWPQPTPIPGPGGMTVADLNRLHQQNPQWYPQYDMPSMPRGDTPLSPAAVHAVVNRGSAPSHRRAAVAPGPTEDEPHSGWRAWGYDPTPDPAPARNFFDRLGSWLSGRGYHAEGGQANPLGTDSRAGFGPIYKEPIAAGPHGYATGGDVPGYLGGGTFHDIVHSVTPFANMIFPGLGVLAQGAGDALTDTISGQTDQIGNDELHDVTLGADTDGKWGMPNIPGLGGLGKMLGIGSNASGAAGAASTAADATDAGSWAGDASSLSDLSDLSEAGSLFARGGRVPGYAAGGLTLADLLAPGMASVQPSAGDRAALDEKASTGPFGTGLKIPASLAPSTAHFGPFGPLAGAGGSGGGGGGSSGSASSSGKGDIASIADPLAKLLKQFNIFGGSSGPTPGTPDSETGITPSVPQGTGTGGGYTINDLDMSSFGGSSGLLAARGGRVPHFAQSGQFNALDEDASTGPFGESIKPAPVVAPSVANFGSFGPLGGVSSGSGGGNSGGGGGSAVADAGGMMGGLGGLLGGVAKIIPFLAEGGKFDYGETPGRGMTNRQKLAYWSAMNMYRGGPFHGRR